MTPQEKAKELVEKMTEAFPYDIDKAIEHAKQCALICVEDEYHSLRELLFNLRATGVIKNEKVYLWRLQDLLNEEQMVKTSIQSL